MRIRKNEIDYFRCYAKLILILIHRMFIQHLQEMVRTDDDYFNRQKPYAGSHGKLTSSVSF